MKNNKAEDVFILTAEYIKYVAPCPTTILTKLTITIFENRNLLDLFKIGARVPMHPQKSKANQCTRQLLIYHNCIKPPWGRSLKRR